MKTIQVKVNVNVYNYSELSESAQKRVLERFDTTIDNIENPHELMIEDTHYFFYEDGSYIAEDIDEVYSF